MEVRLRHSDRRLLMLVGLAAVIGAAAGGAAYLLVRTISLITNAALFGRFAWGEIPPLSDLDPSPRLPIAAAAGALVVAAVATVAPMIRGHGIPETMEAVLRRDSRIAPRTALAKPLSTAVAIGTGAPFGAEGPIIVTGGALGSIFGQILPVTPSERKILLASGAAAGMAATFGTPLASILLAIELLLFELSVRSLIPLAVATSIGGGIHSAVFGTEQLFAVPEHDYAGLGQLPLYAVLGLACGVVAAVISRGLFRADHAFRGSRIPVFWRPLVGAMAFATIGLVVPRSLGVGYDVINDVLAGRLALASLAAVLIAKMLSWWLSLGSGTSGGTLAPVLLMGAAFGGLFASVALDIAPGIGITEGAFAVVGMAAIFGAAAGAPLTAMVFVFELTHDFDVVLPLMLATVLSASVFSILSPETIYTEKLSRRGIRVGNELVPDSLRTTPVADVMSRVVATVAADDTLGEVTARIRSGEHGAFPVVDADGHCLGIIDRRDLLAQEHDDDVPVSDVLSPDLVTIDPSESLLDAMRLMADEDVTHIPVVDHGVMVGICTRADIVRARPAEVALERLEPGWLAPVLQRRERTGKRILVVGNQSLGGQALLDELQRRAQRDPGISVHVVVPLATSDDLADARDRLDLELGMLEDRGIDASGEVGVSDPLTAIETAVRREPATEIVLSTLPPSRSGWLRSNLASSVERRFRLPCTTVHDPDPTART